MAKVKPMYWLSGNYYDCQRKWQDICKLVGDPNVELFECDYNPQTVNKSSRSAQSSDIILALKCKDLFDTRPRILKIKGLPTDYHLMADYLRLASSKNILVIDGPIGYRKPPSKRLITAKTSKFFKTFKKLGTVYQFDENIRNEFTVIKWVHKVVTEHDREIEPAAAKQIVSFKGHNCDTLYAELVKLFDFQTRKKITLEDVNECTVPLFQKQVWDLIDKLYERDVGGALNHLQQFYVTAGVEPGASFRGDIERLLGALYSSFRFLLLAKDLSGDCLDYDKIMNGSRGFKKKTSKHDVEGKPVYEGEYFDGTFINMNINKSSVRMAIKWPKPTVYAAALGVYETRLAIRKHKHVSEYNRGGIKVLVDSLAIFICGKIKLEHFLAKMN